MVEPIDIAIAVHEICLSKLIDKGISSPHDFDQHLGTSRLYMEAFKAAGLDSATGPEIRSAILGVVGWDFESPWPGHPDPEKVVEYYKKWHG